MVLAQLEIIMAERGLSNEQVAAKANLSAKSVMNAKKGRGVSLNTGRHIATALKVPLDKLI